MSKHDETYADMLRDILNNGEDKSDRTGTGTRSVFGRQYRYDLRQSFPLLTTKRVHWKSVVGELLWFLSGSTDVNELRSKYGVTIWDEWATAEQCAKFSRAPGQLGPVYGHQWRSFGDTEFERGVDQIAALVRGLKANPHGRRHIVTGWNPVEVDYVALPPCHTLFQFYVNSRDELSCQLYQRSCDSFLGAPFNIASYALLTHMLAQVCRLRVGEFIHSIGDLHIYSNHMEQVKEQLCRDTGRDAPFLRLNSKVMDIFEFKPEDIEIVNYNPMPTIKAPVAV